MGNDEQTDDTEELRRLARLLIDADAAYHEQRSLDSMLRLGLAQRRLEMVLKPWRSRPRR